MSMITAACHSYEILAQGLETLVATPTELALQLPIPASCITKIVNGKRAVTGDSALCLARWFGDEPEQWMALQAQYDLCVAKTEAGREIADLPTLTSPSVSTAKRQTKPTQGGAI